MRDTTIRSAGHPGVGDVVDGRYRIETIHAVGGMSTVYHATHLLLARPVALKIVSAELLGLPGAAARFLREARAVTHLESDHVIRVFDVGVLDNGCPFLVMEWLDGFDLSQITQRDGPLPVDVAVDYVLQACEALAEVHGRGIVHRDLKPSNLFVVTASDGSRHVKLLDFGVSKIAISGTGTRITRNGTVLGSPSYMSPEQMGEAEDADERTDVWGLGVVLYELLTGKLPFAGDNLTDILAGILLRPTPRAGTLRDCVPSGLDDVIGRCLQADADDRIHDVAELAAALAPFGPEGSDERAEAIAEVRSTALLHPIEPEVAAQDEELFSAVAQRSDGLGSGASVMPFITPVPTGERLELTDERGVARTKLADTIRPSRRTRGRAMMVALCVVALGIGVPAATGRFSRASELWRDAQSTPQAPAPTPSPSPPPPPPTALAAVETLGDASMDPTLPSHWSDIKTDSTGQIPPKAVPTVPSGRRKLQRPPPWVAPSPATRLGPSPRPDSSPPPSAPPTRESPNNVLDSLFEDRK